MSDDKTSTLERLFKFNGEKSKWREWRRKYEAYAEEVGDKTLLSTAPDRTKGQELKLKARGKSDLLIVLPDKDVNTHRRRRTSQRWLR